MKKVRLFVVLVIFGLSTLVVLDNATAEKQMQSVQAVQAITS